MQNLVCLLLVCGTALAAPVPKEKPDPLPDGALVRLGSARYRGPWTDGVVFSKDGKTLYAVRWNVVRRWSADTGTPLDPISFDIRWDTVHDARIWGDRLFVIDRPANGRIDQPHTVRAFELPGGKVVNSFEVPPFPYFTSFGYMQPPAGASEDGKRFAAADQQGKTLTVYDVDSGKAVAEFALDGGKVATERHLSANGKVAAAVGSASVTVFDVDAKKEVCTLPGLFGLTESSPDGKAWVSAKYVDTKGVGGQRRAMTEVVAWDPATGKEKHTLPLGGGAWHFQFCGNDTVIFGHTTSEARSHAGIALTRWNLKTGKADWTVPAPFQASGMGLSAGWIAVSPDGSRFVVSNRESLMTVHDAATGKRVDDNPAHSETVRWAEFSQDGKTVTTLTERDVRVWDAVTGELKTATVPKELDRANFGGVTKDLFVWFERNADHTKTELIAWDRAKNKLAWKADTGLGYVLRVQSAGERIVVAGGSKPGNAELVVVFDQAGKKVSDWAAPRIGFQTPTAVTPEALLVAEGTGNGAVRVLSLESGKETTSIGLPGGDAFRGGPHVITPTPTGEAVLVRAGGGKGWVLADPKTGEILERGEIDGWGSDAAGVSADAKRVFLATGGPNPSAFAFEPKGKSWTLDGKGAAASAVAFSPDGKKTVVGYRDGTALIWDVSK